MRQILIVSIEIFHCSRITCCGINILTTKYFLYRNEYHFYISHQRAMIHIPHIQLKLLCPRDSIASMTLCPARNTRPHLMTTSLLFAIQWEILYQKRSGPNQSHITFQHVDQLRQLINRCRTHKPSNLRQPVRIWQQISIGIPLVRHCLKLDYLEYLPALAGTFLQKECSRPFIGKMQPNRDDQEHRTDADKCEEGDTEVYDPLKKMFIHILFD